MTHLVTILAPSAQCGSGRDRTPGAVEELVARLPRVIEGREGFLPAE